MSSHFAPATTISTSLSASSLLACAASSASLHSMSMTSSLAASSSAATASMPLPYALASGGGGMPPPPYSTLCNNLPYPQQFSASPFLSAGYGADGGGGFSAAGAALPPYSAYDYLTQQQPQSQHLTPLLCSASVASSSAYDNNGGCTPKNGLTSAAAAAALVASSTVITTAASNNNNNAASKSMMHSASGCDAAVTRLTDATLNGNRKECKSTRNAANHGKNVSPAAMKKELEATVSCAAARASANTIASTPDNFSPMCDGVGAITALHSENFLNGAQISSANELPTQSFAADASGGRMHGSLLPSSASLVASDANLYAQAASGAFYGLHGAGVELAANAGGYSGNGSVEFATQNMSPPLLPPPSALSLPASAYCNGGNTAGWATAPNAGLSDHYASSSNIPPSMNGYNLAEDIYGINGIHSQNQLSYGNNNASASTVISGMHYDTSWQPQYYLGSADKLDEMNAYISDRNYYASTSQQIKDASTVIAANGFSTIGSGNGGATIVANPSDASAQNGGATINGGAPTVVDPLRVDLYGSFQHHTASHHQPNHQFALHYDVASGGPFLDLLSNNNQQQQKVISTPSTTTTKNNTNGGFGVELLPLQHQQQCADYGINGVVNGGLPLLPNGSLSRLPAVPLAATVAVKSTTKTPKTPKTTTSRRGRQPVALAQATTTTSTATTIPTIVAATTNMPTTSAIMPQTTITTTAVASTPTSKQQTPAATLSTPQISGGGAAYYSGYGKHGSECYSSGSVSPAAVAHKYPRKNRARANKEITDEEDGKSSEERDLERRTANNTRERIRVRDINTAFKELAKLCSQHMPNTEERSLTKLGTLLKAVDIIPMLEQKVRERNLDPRSSMKQNCERTE